jgi:hypothetical protein
MQYDKGKNGKVYPATGHEGLEGAYSYSSTLSLTSMLDGGGWLTPRPGRFTPGEENRYQLHGRFGGPKGQYGQMRKISPPPAFDPRIALPVASRCTDYVPAHNIYSMTLQKC